MASLPSRFVLDFTKKRNMNTQTRQHRAARRKTSVLDMAFGVSQKGMLGFFMDMWQRDGDLAGIQVGPQAVHLAVHPDHVRHISIANRQNYDKLRSYDGVREFLLGNGLVTSTGDLWKRQRKLMSPFFTPRGVEAYFPVFLSECAALVERWGTLADKGVRVEMPHEMMRVTAAIILKTMFSMESPEEVMDIQQAVEAMIHFVGSGENPLRPPLWVPSPTNRRYLRARERVHSYVDGLIARRRALPAEVWPDDLLSKLMRARDEATGEAMSDQLIRDEAITIFFAGHETTAKTMTFLWYALAKHPAVASKLHAELQSQLGDGLPAIEDLHRLPYTLQVIKETLRLYPPAPMYVRDAVAADTIDGVDIPAGARVLLVPFATHRHPQFWPDPEQFDPDRWEPEKEAAMHPYQYHPFAAGQRICLGNNFALLEAHVLTAVLAKRFAPLLAVNHEPKLVMKGTLDSANGMPMYVVRRQGVGL